MHLPLSFAILVFVVSPACCALAQQTGGVMSDRDKSGLRGPVKTVVDEQTFSGADGQQMLTTITTEYAPDGRILETRTVNPNGSEWVSYSYHSDGRLLKTVSGKPGSVPGSETTYSYDESRRLVGVKSGTENEVRYQYDDKGRKSVVESYDSKPLLPNTAYAPNWEGTDLGFAPYPGGTLTTLYNEQGVATGAQLQDAAGKLVAHIVRKFDEKGRINEEEQVADAPELMIPKELRSKLNGRVRVMERHSSGGTREEVTSTTYNDHGDKASERTTTYVKPESGREYGRTEAGTMIPVGQPQVGQPPATYETQYTYQYDGYGNWTEQSTVARTSRDAALERTSVRRRKLTYY